MSDDKFDLSNLPKFTFEVHGTSQARFADELEKIAAAIRSGQISYLSGGLMIQPTGQRLKISGDLELLVLSTTS